MKNRKYDEEAEASRSIYLFSELLARVQFRKIQGRIKHKVKIGSLTKSQQTLGRLIPKGSLSCNQLKLEHLRLFFTQCLARVQFHKIQER